MKVGILSFHFCQNYGGVLQCAALQKALNRIGIRSDILDFNPISKVQNIHKWAGFMGPACSRLLLYFLGKWRYGSGHYSCFDSFRKTNLSLSSPCRFLPELWECATNYDAIIVGSDQVWNGDWNWPVYLLDSKCFKGIKVSYAACFGHDKQPEVFLNRVRHALPSFHAISVRNTMSQGIINQLTGSNVPIVSDPTLLVDLDFESKTPKLPFSDYILLYTPNRVVAKNTISITEEIRRRLNLPLVCVSPGALRDWAFDGADFIVSNAGPAEWIDLINKSRIVCTDSFHGSVFAIQKRKPLIMIDHKSEGSLRLYDFCERYGFKSNMIAQSTQITDGLLESSPGSNAEVQERIHKHVVKSYEFLRKALT